MSRLLPLLTASAALAALLAPTAAGAQSELAGRPYPKSAFAPSPYARGVKSSSSGAAAPCVGPCGSPSGYGVLRAVDAFPVERPAPQSYGPSSDVSGGRSVHVVTGAAATQMLDLPRGKSAVVDLPSDARDVMVTDPKVADVVLSTPRRIYVTGVASGQTDATFVDGVGRRILHLDIRVDQDWSAAADTLAKMMPGTKMRVHAANNNLILTGEAASAGEADRALKLVGSFVARPEQVVNLITLTGADQVMLKVKIVEVNRSVTKQLGFDLNAVTGQLGMPQYAFLKTPTYGVSGSYLGGLNAGYSVNTTSQPTAAYPLQGLISGLSSAAGLLSGASSVGIPTASIGQFISSFLTGTGTSLNSAQSGYISNYVAGILGNTSTQITPTSIVNGVSVAGAPFTATASTVGITSSNVQQFEQAFLNGGTVNGQALTDPQRLFLSAFNNNINSYSPSSAYSLGGAQASTYVDRSNPANPIQTGRAGSTGLNQANSAIQAFERVGLIRTLAEPDLTVISGESGKFLVGGEFPVPVSQDNAGRITVEFKAYGVGLGYTPVVLSDGRISLKVSTEVSELTNVGGFTLGVGNTGTTASQTQTLSIPGLAVRRAETSVELPSGGSIMIAGLLSAQTKQTLDNIPGLGQVPILGTLLRSRDFQNNETELVIIVTPYLVKATRQQDLATPADGLKIASDIETNLLGRLNSGFGKSPAATAGKSYQGPFGYVVD